MNEYRHSKLASSVASIWSSVYDVSTIYYSLENSNLLGHDEICFKIFAFFKLEYCFK